MSWMPDFLKALFSGAARRDADAKAIDPAQIQMTRQALSRFAAEETGDDQKFIAVEHFLNTLENCAAHSPLNHLLGMRPQSIRVVARISLMNDVAAKKCSFFYEPEEKQPVYAEDMFVSAQYFASHALRLLNETGSAAISDIYLKTLRALEHNMATYKELMEGDMVYVDEKTVRHNFNIGTADTMLADGPRYRPIQIVLRPNNNNGIQPS